MSCGSICVSAHFLFQILHFGKKPLPDDVSLADLKVMLVAASPPSPYSVALLFIASRIQLSLRWVTLS